MGSLTTALPYFLLIVAIFTFLVHAFVFSKIPGKLWSNWYHEVAIVQSIGGVFGGFGFLGYGIFYLTFKHNEIFAFIAILIGFACMLVGLFFSIRVIGLRRQAKEKSKTL